MLGNGQPRMTPDHLVNVTGALSLPRTRPCSHPVHNVGYDVD